MTWNLTLDFTLIWPWYSSSGLCLDSWCSLHLFWHCMNHGVDVPLNFDITHSHSLVFSTEQLITKCTRLFKSVWTLHISFLQPREPYITESSTNSITLEYLGRLANHLHILSRNSNGPSIDHWGIPWSILRKCDLIWFWEQKLCMSFGSFCTNL